MRIPKRSQLAGDGGFTLIELLVVILIVGILAMIALPLFANLRLRAQDTEAQAMLRTVATALEARHVDEDSFVATRAELTGIEPAISEASPALTVSGTEDTFTITETSESGTIFTLFRAADGVLTRTCSAAGRGRCRSDSHW
jgi:type IV pilus assembly protein PilA